MARSRFSLRTYSILGQLAVPLCGFVLAISLVLFQLNRSRQDERRELREALLERVRTLSTLVQLEDKLRQMEFLTDLYSITEDPRFLESRNETAKAARTLEATLLPAEFGPEGSRLADTLRGELSRYLGKDEGTQPAGFAAYHAPPGAEEMETGLSSLRSLIQEDVSRLKRRTDALAHRSGRNHIMFIVLLLAGTGMITWFVLSRVLQPVRALGEYCRTWKLGDGWNMDEPPRSREFGYIYAHLQRMASRLNEQYRTAAEFAELKSKMFSAVMHEVNNSLNSIQMASKLLEQKCVQKSGGEGGQELEKRFFTSIYANIEQLTITARSLLDLSKFEAGQYALDIRPVRIGELIGESVEHA